MAFEGFPRDATTMGLLIVIQGMPLKKERFESLGRGLRAIQAPSWETLGSRSGSIANQKPPTD